MAKLETKAAITKERDGLQAALTESCNQIEVLQEDIKAHQQHRDDLYNTLDSYHDEINELRADVAELTTTSLEVLEALEEAEQDAEAYGRMVDFYLRTLHAISAYGGKNVSIPVGIARAIVEPNLIPVQLDPETGEVSNA